MFISGSNLINKNTNDLELKIQELIILGDSSIGEFNHVLYLILEMQYQFNIKDPDGSEKDNLIQEKIKNIQAVIQASENSYHEFKDIIFNINNFKGLMFLVKKGYFANVILKFDLTKIAFILKNDHYLLLTKVDFETLKAATLADLQNIYSRQKSNNNNYNSNQIDKEKAGFFGEISSNGTSSELVTGPTSTTTSTSQQNNSNDEECAKSRSNANFFSENSLPNPLVGKVFEFLKDVRSIVSVSRINKRLNSLTKAPEVMSNSTLQLLSLTFDDYQPNDTRVKSIHTLMFQKIIKVIASRSSKLYKRAADELNSMISQAWLSPNFISPEEAYYVKAILYIFYSISFKEMHIQKSSYDNFVVFYHKERSEWNYETEREKLFSSLKKLKDLLDEGKIAIEMTYTNTQGLNPNILRYMLLKLHYNCLNWRYNQKINSILELFEGMDISSEKNKATIARLKALVSPTEFDWDSDFRAIIIGMNMMVPRQSDATVIKTLDVDKMVEQFGKMPAVNKVSLIAWLTDFTQYPALLYFFKIGQLERIIFELEIDIVDFLFQKKHFLLFEKLSFEDIKFRTFDELYTYYNTHYELSKFMEVPDNLVFNGSQCEVLLKLSKTSPRLFTEYTANELYEMDICVIQAAAKNIESKGVKFSKEDIKLLNSIKGSLRQSIPELASYITKLASLNFFDKVEIQSLVECKDKDISQVVTDENLEVIIDIYICYPLLRTYVSLMVFRCILNLKEKDLEPLFKLIQPYLGKSDKYITQRKADSKKKKKQNGPARLSLAQFELLLQLLLHEAKSKKRHPLLEKIYANPVQVLPLICKLVPSICEVLAKFPDVNFFDDLTLEELIGFHEKNLTSLAFYAPQDRKKIIEMRRKEINGSCKFSLDYNELNAILRKLKLPLQRMNVKNTNNNNSDNNKNVQDGMEAKTVGPYPTNNVQTNFETSSVVLANGISVKQEQETTQTSETNPHDSSSDSLPKLEPIDTVNLGDDSLKADIEWAESAFASEKSYLQVDDPMTTDKSEIFPSQPGCSSNDSGLMQNIFSGNNSPSAWSPPKKHKRQVEKKVEVQGQEKPEENNPNEAITNEKRQRYSQNVPDLTLKRN